MYGAASFTATAEPLLYGGGRNYQAKQPLFMTNTAFRYAGTAALSLVIAFAAFAIAPQAHAQTYTTAQLQAQVALLMQQVALMQAQLPASAGSYSSTYHYADDCYDDYYSARYCDDYRSTNHRTGTVKEIEVDFVGRVAQVRVHYVLTSKKEEVPRYDGG